MEMKICSKCKRELLATSEYFHNDKHRPDGLTSQCKECRYKKGIFSIVKEVETMPEGHKKCKGCQQILSLDKHFRTYQHAKDGYYAYCISCMIKKKRKGAKDGYKFCNRCNRELPATKQYFYEQESCLDGLDGTCKECQGKNFVISDVEKWSDEEKEIVLKYSLTESKEEILKLLPNRTWKAIRHMALKMGLKLKDNYERIPKHEIYKEIDGIIHKKCKSCRRYLPLELLYYKKDGQCKDGFRNVCKECMGENFAIAKSNNWTEEEINIIKEYYTYKTNREIQEEFMPHRSVELICKKGNELGLIKSEETLRRAQLEYRNDEWRRKISRTRKEKGIHKGANNPMYGSHRIGELNPNWRGGISNLSKYLRRNIKQWKIDSMKYCNYKCVITGEDFDDIHHLYSFNQIVEETLDILNLPQYDEIGKYTSEELLLLEQTCLELHYKYGYGACLKKSVHDLFHFIYGYGNNTPEQFEEFKDKYNNGEFDDLIREVV